MLNLHEKYKRYKYRLDDGWDIAVKENPKDLPYYVTILCRFGEISLCDDEVLYVLAKNHKSIVTKLKTIENAEIFCEGDDEIVFYIDLDCIKNVFRILKPLLNKKESEKVKARFNTKQVRI
ncbi:hypothetical protein CL622_05430 [archaeon]|nr:hypothetical protein [archaeon]